MLIIHIYWEIPATIIQPHLVSFVIFALSPGRGTNTTMAMQQKAAFYVGSSYLAWHTASVVTIITAQSHNSLIKCVKSLLAIWISLEIETYVSFSY